MGPRIKSSPLANGLEQVRGRLLTGLHVGHYKPGDRAPSIRRMAALTHLNQKTIHRAYRHLAEEGLLEVKWGSGTFFTETRSKTTHKPLPISLLESVERCRVEADHLGVDPDVYLRFLRFCMGGRLAGTPIAVAECNREQIGLIERELRATLGVATREVLISKLVVHHPSLLAGVKGVVTTDCHRQEVTEMVAPLRIPVYRVALAPKFTQALIRHARNGPVQMVVRDRNYGPVFLRMLRQMQVPEEIVQRFRIVSPAEYLSRVPGSRYAGSAYVSPLVARELGASARQETRRIRPGPYLASTSIEALRAQLALDLAVEAPK